MQSFAVVLAAVVAAAQGQFAPLPAGIHAAGLPLGAFPYHAGLPLAAHTGALPLQYAAGVQYAGAPAHLNYAAFPAAAPVIPAAVPKTYAVPPARIVEEPAIIETATEKVEQHGYKIKY